MAFEISDEQIDRAARALDMAPRAAFWAPLEYPWSVQNFETRPRAERPRPSAGRADLYVHIPFCRYRCSFCIYAVQPLSSREEMERYVAALGHELDRVAPGAPFERLTVGGGTPTALPPPLFDAMLGTLIDRLELRPGGRRKVEASPDSLTAEHLEVLQRRDIGWVSVGVESLDEGVLGTVHRQHTPEQALEACRKVVASGMKLNADLIYGLPGQTEESFRRDFARLAETGVHRICMYALRLNEKVRAASQLAPEERFDLVRLVRWRAFAARTAREMGFRPTSYYAFTRESETPTPAERRAASRSGEELEVLGIGMSARSQLGDSVYRNHDRLGTYLERVEGGVSPVETVFDLGTEDRKTQVVARTLGNSRALDRATYARRCGTTIDADFGALLARLREGDLIEDDGERIILTELGNLLYDRVALSFYPERARGWIQKWSQHPRVARFQPDVLPVDTA